MRIDVSRLRRMKEGQETVELHPDLPVIEHLGSRVSFPRPADMTVELQRTPKGIDAEVQVDAEGRMTCDRCLEPFAWPVHLEYSELYQTPEEADRTRDEDDGETHVSVYQGDVIDLSEGLAQNLVLAMPMKHTCREDCRGLCPRCGKNLNEGACGCNEDEIDARLAGLRALLDRLKDNQSVES